MPGVVVCLRARRSRRARTIYKRRCVALVRRTVFPIDGPYQVQISVAS